MDRDAVRVGALTTADALKAGCVSGLVALVIYVLRLAPTLVLLGDSAVFVSSAATWGVPQPSGYPLWTLLGLFFTKLPFGELAWRVHLSSALYHAVTVFLVGFLVTRLTTSRLAGLSAALCLAFSRAFFLGSLYAEVFPLNDLFTAAILAITLEIHLRRDEGEKVMDRGLDALALTIGLASAHHQTISLLGPALALLLWKAGCWPRVRDRFKKLFLKFAVPFVLLSALIPFQAAREPLSSWGDVLTLDAWIDLLTRRDYGGLTSPHLGGKPVDGLELAWAWLDGQSLAWTWPLLLLAAFGAIHELRKGDRVVGLALVLAVVVSGPVFAVMNALDVETEHGKAFAERFSTMSAVPIGVLVGLGVAGLRGVAAHALPPLVLRVGLGALFLLPLLRHAPACDLRHDRRGLAVAHDLVNGVPDGSLVLVSGDAMNGAALYVCGVEKRCGKTLVFSPGQMHLEWRVAQLKRRNPDLVLPTPTGKFITVRELVGANLALRRIYLSPQILDLEPPLREMFGFLPDGIHVRALRPEDEASFNAEFPEKARKLARGEGCEGCGMKRSDLFAPSLETSLPFLYALSFENHARVLGALKVEPGLAADLAARAQQADPEGIKKIRGQ